MIKECHSIRAVTENGCCLVDIQYILHGIETVSQLSCYVLTGQADSTLVKYLRCNKIIFILASTLHKIKRSLVILMYM